ncbi:MAG TPA: hypothetical protein VLB85_05590 [Acidimicrobiia bacterium]|nr:hypothetical protein [Acidimicrobiia bacterium]
MSPDFPSYPVNTALGRIAARDRHNRRVRRQRRRATTLNASVGRFWQLRRQIRPTERAYLPSGEVCGQS